MISVEFRSIGPGKCRWCKREKDEVIELAFSDGSFVGRYCFQDFKKALEDKLENDAPPKKPESNTEAPSAAPAIPPVAPPATQPRPQVAAAMAPPPAQPAGNNSQPK